jgi:tRNA 2-thiouridine synthesizing protein C
MKKILFIIESAPFAGVNLQETLDLVLTSAVFDQQVSLLFLDQGVLSIKSGQTVTNNAQKDTAAIFKALEIYQVEEFYVEAESLQQLGLKGDDLLLPVTEIFRYDIAKLLSNNDLILSA